MRVNELGERVSATEDKLMAKRKAEEKTEKQLKDHEERLREITESLRRKKRMIAVPQEVERARGPERIFEQIIPVNFPNFGEGKRHSGPEDREVPHQGEGGGRKSLKQRETRDFSLIWGEILD